MITITEQHDALLKVDYLFQMEKITADEMITLVRGIIQSPCGHAPLRWVPPSYEWVNTPSFVHDWRCMTGLGPLESW